MTISELAADVGVRCATLSAIGNGGIELGGCAAEGDDGVAGLEKVPEHGAAHDAEPDKSNSCHGSSPLAEFTAVQQLLYPEAPNAQWIFPQEKSTSL